MYRFLRPLLFAFEPERAHRLTLRLLDAGHRLGLTRQRVDALPVRVFGLEFANPVGLAAGLDKNGAHIDALAALGFGFIEIGTTTPRAQQGNPPPRLFRLPEHQALINRLGFNNAGVDALVRNVEQTRYHGVLGINIGKNRDTSNDRAVDDYLFCLERVYPLASYVTVNISSPNTRGLRDLQEEETLRRFLFTLRERQEQLAGQHGRRVPLLLKIAPDLDDADLDGIAVVVLASGIDGVICTNTTVTRPGIDSHRHAGETGGLSGRPLLATSTAILQGMYNRLGSALPLIGVGGICSGVDAVRKVQAGASLVQCYSGLVYHGPALVGECVQSLLAHGRARPA